MLKDCTRISFVKKRNNFCYLRAKITDEVFINNHATQELCEVPLAVRYDENSDDDDDFSNLEELNHEDSDDDHMPELEVRNNEDSDSIDDEEEEEDSPNALSPIARKKMALFKDSVTNNHKKMDTIHVNDSRHESGHHGEERLRNMEKLKGFR